MSNTRCAHRSHLAKSLLVVSLLGAGVARAEVPAERARDARADGGSSSAERAERLFDEGRASMKARRYEEACAEFSGSFELDRAAGTLLNLAVCREAQGKTATAWKYYTEALRLSHEQHNEDGARLAAARLQILEPLLCRLTITPPAGPPRGLELRLDGATLDESTWRQALPVDPGSHRVDARAPGRKPWSSSLMLTGESTARVVQIPTLAPERADEPPLSPRGATAHGGVTWPVVAFGATGALAFGMTAYFGLRASSEWNQRQEHCPQHRCDDEAVKASKRAVLFARAADVSAGLGLVASGLAVYWALTGRDTGARPHTGFDVNIERGKMTLWTRGSF